MSIIIKSTITETFYERCQKTPNLVGFQFKEKGQWNNFRFKDFFKVAEELSLGLIQRGLKKGDRVAILAHSSKEWSIADFAILGARAITVPIYPTSTPNEIQFLLKHSGARFLFVGDPSHLNRMQEIFPSLEEEIKIIHFKNLDGILQEGATLKRKEPQLFKKNLCSASPQDPITICYTSGTTGEPKGVVLTHQNIMSVLKDCALLFKNHIRPNQETILTFLPFAHIIGRVESMATFVFGWKESYATSIQDLQSDFIEVKPTLIFSVPRIFEKAFSKIQLHLDGMNWLQKKLFKLVKKQPLLIKLFARKIHQGFGGRLKFAICGGAPIAKELIDFFDQIGIIICEGYGLTETCAPVSLNTFDHRKAGSVGKPLPEALVQIAEDGEILIQSEQLFTEYWMDPEKTKEAFQDGWFKTGDIGFIDPEGYLHITDRKKDLLITSGAKNIAPQKLENLIKSASPLIEEAVVIGDRRKYVTALLTLNPEALKLFAGERAILYSDWKKLTQNDAVNQSIESMIQTINSTLPPYETIKKFIILPESFGIQTGELTASLKVKRAEINRKYRDQIELMYRES